MKNLIFKDGHIVPFTADATYSGGSLVKVGSQVGVACTDVALGAQGELAVHGVFEVPKEAEGLDPGTFVYFKSATGTVTATAMGNTICGFVIGAVGGFGSAQIGDATVWIKLMY
jgi:predicted RecA/RadA family phage recombinase